MSIGKNDDFHYACKDETGTLNNICLQNQIAFDHSYVELCQNAQRHGEIFDARSIRVKTATRDELFCKYYVNNPLRSPTNSIKYSIIIVREQNSRFLTVTNITYDDKMII